MSTRAGVALIGLVVAACGGGSAGTTTISDTTTFPVVTTTTVADVTTTTVPSPVTTHPNLPSAAPGDTVPWDEVGTGWYLVLYDATNVAFSAEDHRPGPVVLYLVNTAGERFEVASWEPDSGPWGLVDAVGSSAIVVGMGDSREYRRWSLVDMVTGASRVVEERGLARVFGEQVIGLARPGGDQLLVHTRPEVNLERIERRHGDTVTTIFSQTYRSEWDALTWLADPDGSVFVAHHDGLAIVHADGSAHELWVPADSRCQPVQRWDDATLLAVCTGRGPGSAPTDEFGEPHRYYGRLWLVPRDGSAGQALTDVPDDPVIVVDFGHHDAFRVGERSYLQWRGDCGAAAIDLLVPGHALRRLAIVHPHHEHWGGIAVLAAAEVGMVVHAWKSCDGSESGLFAIDPEAVFRHDLVPLVGDAHGVIGVIALGS